MYIYIYTFIQVFVLYWEYMGQAGMKFEGIDIQWYSLLKSPKLDFYITGMELTEKMVWQQERRYTGSTTLGNLLWQWIFFAIINLLGIHSGSSVWRQGCSNLISGKSLIEGVTADFPLHLPIIFFPTCIWGWPVSNPERWAWSYSTGDHTSVISQSHQPTTYCHIVTIELTRQLTH